MELDSSFKSLFNSFKMDGPWIHPKTWESIVSESGTARSIDHRQGSQDSLYDLSAISESNLIRLVINALQGVNSAIIKAEKLSHMLCLIPADRSFLRVPSLWCLSSSTHALGKMLKSIVHSGLLYSVLYQFFCHFIGTDLIANLVQKGGDENHLISFNGGQGECKMHEYPPYSLVNQAFAVAIGKILEGYICALNTLSSSIKFRRYAQRKGGSFPVYEQEGTLTSVALSEMTFMEVYLHTKELRTQIEVLGSICFSQHFYHDLLRDGLRLNYIDEFQSFPRGADLLTYLYVLLRDADPVHQALLKYLFACSYKPYSSFIKSSLYRTTINDPYGEFFISSCDAISLTSIKERVGVPIPCFLMDVCQPLLRAGQQLQVLVKLIDLCDLSCASATLTGMLPFWADSSIKLDFLLDPLKFDISGMEALIRKREAMYKNMMEKLQIFLKELSVKYQCPTHYVDVFGSIPLSLGRSMDKPFTSMLDGESHFIQENINVNYCDSDSDASISSAKDGFELERSPSSECSSHDYNDDGNTAEISYDLEDNASPLYKSMFLNLSSDCVINSILQTYHPKMPSSPNSDAIKDHRMLRSTGICLSAGTLSRKLKLEYGDGGPNMFSNGETFPPLLHFDGSKELQTSSFNLPNAFSMNPMLTKTPWLPTVASLRDALFNDSRSYLRNFNFSSVADPFKLHPEKMILSFGHRLQDESLGVSSGGVKCSCGPIKATVEKKPFFDSPCTVGGANVPSDTQHLGDCGGADWVKSLYYPVKRVIDNDGDFHLEPKFLVPLDIVIDRCILQEILLQYKYISCFTIKFLEEGFNLHQHLLALRRYYFMEVSDWADLFVMSLGCLKCSSLEQEHKATSIQELLGLALQRSSCENDPYKERLFINMKGQSIYQSVLTNGINAFDFVVLGYRVDWPVNIVISQDALQIYASVFSFLMQIRLAAASLIALWHYLKEAVYAFKQVHSKMFCKIEDFNSLLRMRHQIYHFTITLQQYVQSQLSGATWCKFQESLKYKVNDMLDLESVHMMYLADALHVCFLSDDGKEVATIIKNILQCALDFHLCFSGIGFSDHLYEKDESYLHSQINFTQASAVNNTFMSNLKNLYLLYLKSPERGEFSLNRFWSQLNFNNYYSAAVKHSL